MKRTWLRNIHNWAVRQFFPLKPVLYFTSTQDKLKSAQLNKDCTGYPQRLILSFIEFGLSQLEKDNEPFRNHLKFLYYNKYKSLKVWKCNYKIENSRQKRRLLRKGKGRLNFAKYLLSV